MRKLLRIGIILSFFCCFLVGCSGKKLYSKKEMQQLHDVVGLVQAKQLAYDHVITNSLPKKIENMAMDTGFLDLLSTMQYDPNKPVIAFTFDDGPRTNTTPDLLDILEENGAKATFFVVGSYLDSDTAPILKRMISLGCQVGNHTMTHANLATLDVAGIHNEVDTNNNKILEITGRECRLLRPPYGSSNDTVAAEVKQPMINWAIDTLDWSSRDADAIIPIVREQVADGTIILMHDIYPSTVEACRTLIPELVEEGYQLVTVTELAYMKGITLEPGGTYYYFQ